MSVRVPKLKLSNGLEMPVIGLGTYARKSTPGQFRQAVEWGIEAGYRHIDTAACYRNEEEVGEGINNKINLGLVKREDLFVTTKLWNDRHAEKDVVPALKESLGKLNLDYVDLYLVHWPVSHNGSTSRPSANRETTVALQTTEGMVLPQPQSTPQQETTPQPQVQRVPESTTPTGEQTKRDEDSKFEETSIEHAETWRGMEECVKLGLARSIGVSNFNEEQLDKLLQSAKIKPVVNQVEINPTLTQHKLVDYCTRHSIVPVAYTPLGLISEARPEFIGKDVIKTDPKLGEIAAKYGKTRAQIGLKYLVQRGIPVIPKSFTKSRIEENLNIFDFELTESEMTTVDSYNLDHRCVPGTDFKNLKNYPF